MAVDFNPSYLSLKISSTLSSFGSDRRYVSSTIISDLKGKLELVTGATASMMQLQLLDEDGKMICEIDNDSAMLDSYPVKNGYRIHVIDKDPSKSQGQFEDTSGVQKFEISADAYSKRTDSVQAFKKRMKLGRFGDQDPVAEAEAAARLEEEKLATEAIAVGSRCEITGAGGMPKRGVVMFTGVTEFQTGYWVGVKYDEPVGKNDGRVRDKRYFTCPPKYGGFVKPKNIQTGDFPEENFSDDEM